MNLSKKAISWIIGIGVAITLAIIVISSIAGVRNRVVTLEENTNTSHSNISKEERRRADLFNNLADAVESYNKFEQSTMTQIIEARKQATGGNVESAALMLAAVVEAYPELKSQANYQTAMTEFSVTENRVAQYREQYNNDVRGYNKYTRSFWPNFILTISGYDKQDYKYLDYNVSPTEHRDLFN